jgi:hypothetical protein
MLEVIGSFKVNKLRWTTGNIQFAILFLKDRMLFDKVGGQFADLYMGAFLGFLVGLVGANVGANVFGANVFGTFISGVVGAGVGGGVGYIIEEKLRKQSFKEREEKIKSLTKLSINEIIKLDKNNFEIIYKDIFKIEIKKTSGVGSTGARVGTLSIEGKKKEKYDIIMNQKFEECEKIVKEVLSDKLK